MKFLLFVEERSHWAWEINA